MTKPTIIFKSLLTIGILSVSRFIVEPILFPVAKLETYLQQGDMTTNAFVNLQQFETFKNAYPIIIGLMIFLVWLKEITKLIKSVK